jgi:G3E family GTPase
MRPPAMSPTMSPTMSPAERPPPVPTLLLTGFLGAGKTTLLSGWLAERPAHERWAVLVNEFGALGVDRALLGGDGADPAVLVAEVAGGCACCAARVAFATTLTRLLRKGPWDRLFIETTGLGHPSALFEQLRAPAFAGRLALLPPVAVVDATRAALYVEAARPGHRIARDQLVMARLLVLNRAEAVGRDAAAALGERLSALPPWPRAVLPTASGVVPLGRVLAALDADRPEEGGRPPMDEGDGPPAEDRAEEGASPATPATPVIVRPEAPPHARDAPVTLCWQREEAGTAAAGWWWPGSVRFDRPQLMAALDGLAAADGPLRARGLLRAKGVFRTERAWYAWQWVDGVAEWDETAWCSDSRFELLVESPIHPQVVDDALRAAVRKG